MLHGKFRLTGNISSSSVLYEVFLLDHVEPLHSHHLTPYLKTNTSYPCLSPSHCSDNCYRSFKYELFETFTSRKAKMGLVEINFNNYPQLQVAGFIFSFSIGLFDTSIHNHCQDSGFIFIVEKLNSKKCKCASTTVISFPNVNNLDKWKDQ